MAFECTLTQNYAHADYFSDGRHATVFVRIGRDPEKLANYFLQVSLEPTGGDDMEYEFYIIEVLSDPKDERSYWQGLDIKNLIDDTSWRQIIDLLLKISSTLIHNEKPQSFFWCADAKDSTKAFEKHEQVVHVFRSLGYRVETADPYMGVRMWRAEWGENSGVE